MKRLISLVLLIIIVSTLVFSLFGCARNREYNEAEVIEAAKTLIKKSEELNLIYYGEGLPYSSDPSAADGYYYVVDYSAAARYGISTLADLSAKTKAVYSEKLAASMIKAGTTSVYEGETLLVSSRYYQKYDPLTNEPIDIMVYSNYNPFLTDDVVYDYGSITVLGSEREIVYVTINATATNEEGKTQTNLLKIGLIEETNGWRLNSPTYTSYIDREAYEELENK